MHACVRACVWCVNLHFPLSLKRPLPSHTHTHTVGSHSGPVSHLCQPGRSQASQCHPRWVRHGTHSLSKQEGTNTSSAASYLSLVPRLVCGLGMRALLARNQTRFLSCTQSNRDFYIFYPTNPSQDKGVYAVRWQQYKAHYHSHG